MNAQKINTLFLKSVGKISTAFLLSLFLPTGAFAQEVTPEIQLGARGVMSLNGLAGPGNTSSAVNDFSDTAVLLGLEQHLFSDYRGRLVVGFQFPDADSDLGQVFYHQVMFELNNKSNQFKIGRTRLNSSLIEFTTLRDDDALAFTNVINPFASGSVGRNSENTQFGNVVQYGHVFHQRWWIKGYAAHYTEIPQLPLTREEDFNTNGGGAVFMYKVPLTQIWNRPVIQQVGIGTNIFSTSNQIGVGRKKPLTSFQFSTILNLKRDPVNLIELRYQTLYNMGFNEVQQVNDFFDYARTESISTYTMLRYLRRNLEFPAYQASLGGGFKTFPGLDNHAGQYKLLANYFYRLGDSFDIGAQYAV